MPHSLAELLHGGPMTVAELERVSDTLTFERGRDFDSRPHYRRQPLETS